MRSSHLSLPWLSPPPSPPPSSSSGPQCAVAAPTALRYRQVRQDGQQSIVNFYVLFQPELCQLLFETGWLVGLLFPPCPGGGREWWGVAAPSSSSSCPARPAALLTRLSWIWLSQSDQAGREETLPVPAQVSTQFSQLSTAENNVSPRAQPSIWLWLTRTLSVITTTTSTSNPRAAPNPWQVSSASQGGRSTEWFLSRNQIKKLLNTTNQLTPTFQVNSTWC